MSVPPALQPSDIYPAFAWSRLIALGELAWKARTWVAEHVVHQDSRCSIGLRGWEHTKNAIIVAAAKENSDWLSITDPGAKFRFKLDMMPIRFCRGDANEPLPTKYAFSDPAEQEQVELAFSGANLPNTEGLFRFLVDADAHGNVLGTYLVLGNLDGTVAMTWQIPRANSQGDAAPIVIPQTPITLGPLKVRTKKEIAAEEERLAEEAMAAERAIENTSNEKGA